MTADVIRGVPPGWLFAAALDGAACSVVGYHGRRRPLHAARWTGSTDATDHFVLAHCVGATIDLGCGPGRMAAELTRQGHRVVGVDISATAVRHARQRGVVALRRDVMSRLPGEGRWQTALLADGNIGIGGDPSALLTRVHGLVAPGGRIVVDLAPPGTGLRVHSLQLAVGDVYSTPFPWAQVDGESLRPVADEAGLSLDEVSEWRGRWVGVLTRPGRAHP